MLKRTPVQIMKKLAVEVCKNEIKVRNDVTPLHVAAEIGSSVIFQFLIEISCFDTLFC